MAFRASPVALFHATVPAARRAELAVKSSAPTQIILRQLASGGPQTVHQLWDKVEVTGKFASKNIMKHSLDFLRRHSRVETKPQEAGNHKVNFVYKLGEKPNIVPHGDTAAPAV